MDENVLGLFKEVYPDEFTEFSENKNSSFHIILLKNKWKFNRMISYFRNEFTVRDNALREIHHTLIKRQWSSELALEFLSSENVRNVMNYGHFQSLYQKALEYKDIPVLEKIIEVFPERIKILNTETVKKTLCLIPKLEEIFKS